VLQKIEREGGRFGFKPEITAKIAKLDVRHCSEGAAAELNDE
jgi:hypothetical protein